MDRIQTAEPMTLGGDNRFHILQPLSGEFQIEGDVGTNPLKLGDTCLLPATLGETKILPEKECSFLDMYLPIN
jgi:mannose-6-phosphate isomerase class I